MPVSAPGAKAEPVPEKLVWGQGSSDRIGRPGTCRAVPIGNLSMMNRKILASMLPILLAAHMATLSAGARAEIPFDVSAMPGIESRIHIPPDGLSEGMAEAFQEIAKRAQSIGERSEALALILPASQASVEMPGDQRRAVIVLAATLLRPPAPTILPEAAAMAALRLYGELASLADPGPDTGSAALAAAVPLPFR